MTYYRMSGTMHIEMKPVKDRKNRKVPWKRIFSSTDFKSSSEVLRDLRRGDAKNIYKIRFDNEFVPVET